MYSQELAWAIIKCICINKPLGTFIIISIALCNNFQADSTDLFSFLIEPSIPKLWALAIRYGKCMVKVMGKIR